MSEFLDKEGLEALVEKIPTVRAAGGYFGPSGLQISSAAYNELANMFNGAGIDIKAAVFANVWVGQDPSEVRMVPVSMVTIETSSGEAMEKKLRFDIPSELIGSSGELTISVGYATSNVSVTAPTGLSFRIIKIEP